MPPVQPTVQLNKSFLEIIGWFALVVSLVPVAIIIVVMLANVIGGCEGALGSGVTCTRADLSSVIMMGEVLFLLGIIIAIPAVIVGGVIGIIGTIRALMSQGKRFSSLPYPYLLIVSALGACVMLLS